MFRDHSVSENLERIHRQTLEAPIWVGSRKEKTIWVGVWEKDKPRQAFHRKYGEAASNGDLVTQWDSSYHCTSFTLLERIYMQERDFPYIQTMN